MTAEYPTDADHLIDDWLAKLGGGGGMRDARAARVPQARSRPGADANAASPLDSSAPPTARVESIGDVTRVSFADRKASVLLEHHSRWLHRGTLPFRGIASLQTDLIPELVHALDIVGSWFGAPWDAVNVTLRRPHLLAFGFWRMGGPPLAACLAEFQRRAPERAESALGRFGIAIHDESRDEATTPVLSLRRPNLLGPEAEAAIARDPVLLAALAGVGRDCACISGQLSTVMAHFIEPALQQKIPGTEKTVREGLADKDAYAALVFMIYCFEKRGAEMVAEWLASEQKPALDQLAARLVKEGCANEARNILRLASLSAGEAGQV